VCSWYFLLYLAGVKIPLCPQAIGVSGGKGSRDASKGSSPEGGCLRVKRKRKPSGNIKEKAFNRSGFNLAPYVSAVSFFNSAPECAKVLIDPLRERGCLRALYQTGRRPYNRPAFIDLKEPATVGGGEQLAHYPYRREPCIAAPKLVVM